MKCDHCPAKHLENACRGELNKTFCKRSDINSPEYNEIFSKNMENFATVATQVKQSNQLIGIINNKINTCKNRSKRKTSINQDGISVITHVITNDDGSETIHGDCGCGLNVCALGKGRGDGFVSYNDCHACILAQMKKESLEPPARNRGFGDNF